MRLGYDNLNDAQTKLNGTYAYYDGKAILIKSVHPRNDMKPNNGEYLIIPVNMAGTRQLEPFHMEDPKFNCWRYNLGYANKRGYAAWFYRRPVKQWKQGLRHDQVDSRFSAMDGEYGGIDFRGVHIAEMLENRYAKLSTAAAAVQQGEAKIMAFHRHFALSFDKFHDDFLVEYKGVKFASSKDLKSFKIVKGFEHIDEALKEAIA